jgi:hypothetical protein
LSPPRTHHLRISSEPMNHARRSAASPFFIGLLVLCNRFLALERNTTIACNPEFALTACIFQK